VRIALVVSAAALAVAACSRPAPQTHTVTIAKMAFGPVPDAPKVGDTIEWVNADAFEHTVTARDGSFDVDLPPGGRARTVLRKPGPVDFYCRYHPGMTGRLDVGGDRVARGFGTR
jgi:plastocyanin